MLGVIDRYGGKHFAHLWLVLFDADFGEELWR